MVCCLCGACFGHFVRWRVQFVQRSSAVRPPLGARALLSVRVATIGAWEATRPGCRWKCGALGYLPFHKERAVVGAERSRIGRGELFALAVARGANLGCFASKVAGLVIRFYCQKPLSMVWSPRLLRDPGWGAGQPFLPMRQELCCRKWMACKLSASIPMPWHCVRP